MRYLYPRKAYKFNYMFGLISPKNFSEKSTLDVGSNVKLQKLRSYSDYFFERFISPNQEEKKVPLDIGHFTLSETIFPNHLT